MHIVAALIFTVITLGAVGLIAHMLLAHKDRIATALEAPSLGVDAGYAWVARVRRVARPVPTVSRFRPLPQMRPVRARA